MTTEVDVERRLKVALAKADADNAEKVTADKWALANEAVERAKRAGNEASRLRTIYLDLADEQVTK